MSALIVIALLMASIAGIIYYAGASRGRAINVMREAQRMSCTETGLSLARAYFGREQFQWNTYLADPQHYNPMPSNIPGWTPSDPFHPIPLANLIASHPELFVDIDGDTLPDVYLYIRDNEDEGPGLTNWMRDNDQNVIVGAVCISTTMVPRTALDNHGIQVHGFQSVEGLLSYNMPSNGYTQVNGGDGSGNFN